MKRIITSLLLGCLICGCATPAQKRVREKMAEIMIPEIDFRQISVFDAMTAICDLSRDFDSKTEEKRKGVSIVICLTPTNEHAIAKADPFEASEHSAPVITFNARNISLLDALDAVSEISGIKYVIDKNGIIQFKKRGPTKP